MDAHSSSDPGTVRRRRLGFLLLMEFIAFHLYTFHRVQRRKLLFGKLFSFAL
jgi:hypothetical protein